MMMIKHFQIKNRLGSHQSGMTLLEVLIALLVLSIGMVGLGALLLTALTNVHSSSQYSLASAVALDFEERLWFEIANRSAENPDSLNQGCLSQAQIDDVAEAMIDQWTKPDDSWEWTGAARFLAPDLNVDIGRIEVDEAMSDGEGTGIRWQKLENVSITWREGRFDLEGDSERVVVSIGLVCRPTF